MGKKYLDKNGLYMEEGRYVDLTTMRMRMVKEDEEGKLTLEGVSPLSEEEAKRFVPIFIDEKSEETANWFERKLKEKQSETEGR